MFDTLPVPCPSCKKQFGVPMRSAHNGTTWRCPRCRNGTVTLKGNELPEVDRAFRDLERTLKSFGGKLTRKSSDHPPRGIRYHGTVVRRRTSESADE